MSGKSIFRSILLSIPVTGLLPFLLNKVLVHPIPFDLVCLGIIFVVVLSVLLLASFLADKAGDFYASPGAEEIDLSDNDDRELGTVKWFNVSKGFGFITRDNDEDVFVHFRNIRGRGHRSLMEGQQVLFMVCNSDKGLQAENVSVIRR